MSASKKRGVTAKTASEQTGNAGLDDEIVREYLKNNDNFLQRNPDMLDYLHISHATGSAISLVEKQVSVMRERNKDMRQRLKTLTANARDNDALFEQTRVLVLKLLDADSVSDIHDIFTNSMTSDFRADYACMILYGDHGGEGWRTETPETVKREIGSLFRGNKAVCGALRGEELTFLFPGGSGVGSAALMPLTAGDAPQGLIAVGSADANYYNSKVGTMFLSHLADVIVKLLSRLRGTGA